MTVVRSGSPAVGLRCSAPAKLNLGLRVLGKRPDGYHELESLFVPLDLADEIAVDVVAAPSFELELEVAGEVAGIPRDDGNLAARAARGFARAAALGVRVRLRLHKRIPAGAGLGGGSSDAGAVLRALARLFPSALDRAALAELALGLGADVPFFLDPQPALVRGIGERIEPVAGLRSLCVVLANPGTPLATADVYGAFDALGPALTASPADRTLPPLWRSLGVGPATSGSSGSDWPAPDRLALENDLEPAATHLCPSVARLREQLGAAGARASGMSGSGPTVFGLFDSPADAEKALSELGVRAPSWARVATTAESR